jgi:drug/metabolite transporter (DMT)-like permease
MNMNHHHHHHHHHHQSPRRRNVTSSSLISSIVIAATILLITVSPTSRRGIDAFHIPTTTTTKTLSASGRNNRRSISLISQSKSTSKSISTKSSSVQLVRLRLSTATETETNTTTTTTTTIDTLDDLTKNGETYLDAQGVVCARGVCVIVDDDVAPEICILNDDMTEVVCEPNPDSLVTPGLSIAYLWPRMLLLICSVLYGTNFPLGRLMNDALPASAATSNRLMLASIALSPFLFQLKPSLRSTAAVCGTFTALGYISQSIALVDTPAATVSFLGALVVIVCPALAVVVDKKKMGFSDAPQTWIAAITCLFGVGVLELGGDGGLGDVGWGDFWSLLQAVGFGTSFFLTERMMAKEPSQALPITAMQCAMSAGFAGIWAGLDGTGFMDGALAFGSPHGAWLFDENVASTFTLPGLFFDDTLRNVALAAAFTGFITTAGNRVGETVALGKLSSSEASVLLATEPLWAAVFASFLINEQLSLWDGAGGALIVLACVATAIDPVWLREKLNIEYDYNNNNKNSNDNE